LQPRYLLLCLLLSAANPSRAQVKITDTIFYNAGWQISEQETAKYYRAGILAALDSFWYYTGKVKDHTIDGKLLMEGNYSPVGQKHGKFIFYYPEGGKRFYGDFDKDRMVGVWSWFYPNGNLHAMIYFPGDGKTFQFLKFLDQSGKQTLENGIGDFSWHTAPLYAGYAGYFVEGSVDKGKRTGTWSYSSGDGSSKVLFREKYDKEGALDKVVVTDFGKAGKRDPFPIDFIPLNLRVTESIAYDPFFAVNGDSMVTQW
jgi:antitoxin component YwqK of YwqJK toxin-antitoxin module